MSSPTGRRVTVKIDLALDNPDRLKKAMEGVAGDLKAGADQIAKIKQALDPGLLAARVRQENELVKAREAYNAALGAERQNQDLEIAGGHREEVEAVRTAEQKRLEIQKGINETLERQEDIIARINIATRAKNLERAVALDLKKERAKGQYESAYAAEREKQSPTTAEKEPGLLARFFQGFAGGASGRGNAGAKANAGAAETAVSGGTGVLGALVGGGGIGAGVGAGLEAALGPAGVAIAALTPIVQKLAAAPFNIVDSGLKELSGSLGVLGVVVPGFLRGITDSLVSFAGKAQPGMFRVWQFALEDTVGVIGHKMVPFLRMATEGVRFFADVLTTILPSSKQIEAVLAPLRGELEILRMQLTKLALEVGPLITTGLVYALQDMAGAAVYAAQAMQSLTAVLQSLGLAGNLKPYDELKSGRGAASRQVTFGGVEDLQRQMISSAFTSGIEQGPKPEEKMKSAAELQHQAAVDFTRAVTTLQSFLGEIMTKGVTGATVDAIARRTAKGLLGW